MLGLTTIGLIHTAISLIAVIAGVWSLARDKEISLGRPLGQVYLVATAATAATALGIFQHGGFGPPHVLAILTLMALALGTAAALVRRLGALPRYVQALCYSATLLFHMIPGFTETLTRLPPGKPVLPSAEAPELGLIYGMLLLVFVAGVAVQLRYLSLQKVA